MAVRTAYVGTQVAGDVLTAANFSKLPGGWIGYAEVTANQGSITTEVDLTGLTVTVTVNTTRRIKVIGSVSFQGTVADDTAYIVIHEDAVQKKVGNIIIRPTGQNLICACEVVLTPAAGSHTYKLRAARNSGTGTIMMAASATNLAFILVEDIGPAT